MAVFLGSETEPSKSLDASLRDLRPIIEDSESLVRLASLEGLTEHFDFGYPQKPPKRSPTYPFASSGPSKAHISKSLGKNGHVNHNPQEHRVVPPIPKSEVHNEPSSTGLVGPPIRHSSTINTTNSASFEDTAVWDHKAILSLDGGGIRGYSALLILQELMKVIGRIEESYARGPSLADGPAESSYHPHTPLSPAPCMVTSIKNKVRDGGEPVKTESSPWLPCHYFDYVAGTSTGGLIGIMLGRLRMNVDDCITEYENLGAKVFGRSRKCHIRSPLFWPRDKYNFKILENVVRDVVRRRVPKVPEFPGGRNFAFDENRCRTVVVSYQQQSKVGTEEPYLFRTYKNLHKSKDPEGRKLDRNPDLAHDIPIWQVARATSAAPTYFKPPIIDGLEYVDGGFGANNPCAEIYEEVRRMNNNSKRCASIILSVGTGKNNEARRFKGTGIQRYLNYLNFARKWASDSEKTHLEMLKARSEVNFNYFRLNVDKGLALMKLDEWRARGPRRTKIGECIGTFRSSSLKDEKVAGTGAPVGQKADVREEKHESLQNGIGTTHMNGNGDMDDLGPFREPGEQHALDTTDNAIIAHLEHSVDGLTTNAFSQQNGHLLTTNVTGRELNPDVEDTKIPQWFRPKNQTLESIRKYTEDYLLLRETKDMIEDCAKLLVEGRRGRARSDPQRWEKACFGTWYQCRMRECPRGEKEYEQRWQLRKHLLDKHKSDFTRGPEGKKKLEEALDSCKIVVH